MSEGVRKHPRVDRNLDLVWAIEARQLSGRGKIVNLSVTGACIKLDASFTGDKTAQLSLICPSIPKLPTRAKLQWVRRVAGAQPHVLIGVAFTQQQNEAEWSRWFEAQGQSAPAQSPQLAASGGRR
jgi:hypothetical protein